MSPRTGCHCHSLATVRPLPILTGRLPDVIAQSGLIRFRSQMKGKWFKATEKTLAEAPTSDNRHVLGKLTTEVDGRQPIFSRGG